MRIGFVSAIDHIVQAVRDDLGQRLPRQRKTQRDNLATLVGTMLHIRRANIMELAAGLPRDVERIDMRYQWIIRFLGNKHVVCDDVMEPYARQALEMLAASGTKITLILDQSKISDQHQVLMLALRYADRALPLAWRVETTEGNIGFETQKHLLEAVAPWIPPGVAVTLMGDRFYGTADLIEWCQDHAWHYRLRLKGNLIVRDGADKTTTGACAKSKTFYFEDVQLTARKAPTHIGIIHDPGHEEAWIIAMDEKPGYLQPLDYSGRWGIEPMVSDFKSRGFGIEDSQLQYPDRLARLILVMALALYWAVSTGLSDTLDHALPCEKRPVQQQPKKVCRSRLSIFKRGMRYILKIIQFRLPIPPLWNVYRRLKGENCDDHQQRCNDQRLAINSA
jgi:hypothetical protein